MKRFTRREFLRWSAVGGAGLFIAACSKSPTNSPSQPAATAAPVGTAAAPGKVPAITVADLKGLKSKYPQQFELAEFEQAINGKLSFTENPKFKAEVDAGKLPPVERRLPEEPLVVVPYTELGKYGGRMRGVSFAPESGTSEVLSWRHVNLVRYSDDLKTLVPNVCKSWEWNKDYTEITFTLRKGHKWSDGEPFTVDDILFWWEDIKLNKDLTPEVPSEWTFGGEPMKIEKIDEVTFKVKFAAPAPGFLISLNGYIQPWQPKHFLSQFHIKYNPAADAEAKKQGYSNWVELFRSYYNDWKDSYHRTGVPTLESHVLVEETTEHRLLAANPYYFKVDTAGQQLPYIDEHYETFIADKEVTNLKVIAGEIDQKGYGLDLASYPVYKENEAKGNYTVQLAPAGLGMGVFYCFNITHKDPVKRKIFSDVRFKQAMSLALNRDEINKVVYLGQAKPMQGLPADPISNPFVTAEQASYMTQYDPAKANQLLDEMGLTNKTADGFRLQPNGKPLTIYMEYCQQATPGLLNELVKQYWEAVGVKVELKEVSTEAYRARTLTNDHDIALWNNDGTAGPSLIADQQRLYPPFATGLTMYTGSPWHEWWQSGGKQGEEPPEDMKKLRDLAMKFGAAEPYSDEWMKLGKEIVDIHNQYLFTIGTVGDVPTPVVVSNRIGNAPKWTVQLWDFYWTYPFRMDQCFIKA